MEKSTGALPRRSGWGLADNEFGEECSFVVDLEPLSPPD